MASPSSSPNNTPPISVSTHPPTSPIPSQLTVPRTVAQVEQWLCAHGFEHHTSAFVSNEVDGRVLQSLTSEELRDDLGVTKLSERHRLLSLLDKMQLERLVSESSPNLLPEHGRILDHLSNVRTYHSWVRVGVQLLSFALVTLRLAPDFRHWRYVSATAFYLAAVGVLALVYGVLRYRAVVQMIDSSTLSEPQYTPDRIGVGSLIVLVAAASVLCAVMIALEPPPKSDG